MSGNVLSKFKDAKVFIKNWKDLGPEMASRFHNFVCINPASAMHAEFKSLTDAAKYFCLGVGRSTEMEEVDGKIVKYFVDTYEYYNGVSASITANVSYRHAAQYDDPRIHQQEETRKLVGRIRKYAVEKKLTNVHAFMGLHGTGVLIMGTEVSAWWRYTLDRASNLETEICREWWEDAGLKDYFEQRLEELKISQSGSQPQDTNSKDDQAEDTQTEEQSTSSLPQTVDS